ncbi:spore germination protein GerPB [Virgibacillus halodenitrificans]|jgi:spore germination protein PB|uniref:Spore gernimation protein KA n=1 Tax=Virgibacillus halodenitrificans TaxID=1482 RepID=A0AAC9IXG7_VIRHA|nr:spore germination protein GerPB [Virgibacillus halodenitrificans]APC47477.1 spore gernimation protein KA [Virgibacillus halodenitrificans]MBD1221760.1 spore gernimation protein KA [Virgibacillus halodenitrificans]MCG1029518.1 spore gernimation protein KA [Virgibacillus halodenitrificans]MCJ0932295.1 spore germination protein GerPB [Virgibacillus halodenitrificans]MEC2158611.1 spore germination protein GerPB [Virgibacillus halodenitrificans]
MHFTVHQSINIYMIKIGAITNSSVMQIGSSGSIQAQSDVYNTGGYTEPAEEAAATGEIAPIVPLGP